MKARLGSLASEAEEPEGPEPLPSALTLGTADRPPVSRHSSTRADHIEPGPQPADLGVPSQPPTPSTHGLPSNTPHTHSQSSRGPRSQPHRGSLLPGDRATRGGGEWSRTPGGGASAWFRPGGCSQELGRGLGAPLCTPPWGRAGVRWDRLGGSVRAPPCPRRAVPSLRPGGPPGLCGAGGGVCCLPRSRSVTCSQGLRQARPSFPAGRANPESVAGFLPGDGGRGVCCVGRWGRRDPAGVRAAGSQV